MRTFFLGLKTIDCFHESPLMQAQQCQLKTTTMLIKATQHCCIFFTPKKWFRDNLLGDFLSLLLFFTMSDRHFYTYWVKLVYKHIYSYNHFASLCIKFALMEGNDTCIFASLLKLKSSSNIWVNAVMVSLLSVTKTQYAY